jgi:threonine/homoserine/homoserine lactone efflux protein
LPPKTATLKFTNSPDMNDAHPAENSAPRVDDRMAILLASPLIGIAVGWASGVLHDSPVDGAMGWLSILFLAAIAYLLWFGNRLIFYRVRDRAASGPRAASPRHRLLTVVAMAASFSAPTAYLAHLAWYRLFVADEVNDTAIHAATALVTLTSLFFAHTYEAILLGREHASQCRSFDEMQQHHLEAEVRVLEGHLDPHFIYNALCSLGFLIETNRGRAGAYVARLSSVYAYVTKNFTARLVGINEELAFARAFAELLKLRHGDAIQIVIPENLPGEDCLIVPMSIQIALENAAKHNDSSPGNPLRIEVRVVVDDVVVFNRKCRLLAPQESHGVGLPNLSNRCQLCVGRDIEVIETDETYLLCIPLMHRAR